MSELYSSKYDERSVCMQAIIYVEPLCQEKSDDKERTDIEPPVDESQSNSQPIKSAALGLETIYSSIRWKCGFDDAEEDVGWELCESDSGGVVGPINRRMSDGSRVRRW